MGVFYKIFKINELICGTSGNGYINPFVGTESILVKCKKMALNYFLYHSVQSDSGEVMVNIHTTGLKFMGDNCLFLQPVAESFS